MSESVATAVRTDYISANGLDIYVQEAGTGTPLLLLHGGTATSDSWQGYVPALAHHFRVIAPDTRGHGRTKNPGSELSYRLLADDVAALVQAMSLDKPHICGYSDGGQIALEIGMRYPSLARALVVGAAVSSFTDAYFDAMREMGIEGPGMVDFAHVQNKLEGVLEFWKSAHASLGGPDYWQTLLRNISVMWLTPLNYTTDDFRRIIPPTLLLLGDRDEGVPVEQAVEMYRMIPNAELAILPNGTHETTIGSTGINPLFLNVVSEFLLRHRV